MAIPSDAVFLDDLWSLEWQPTNLMASANNSSFSHWSFAWTRLSRGGDPGVPGQRADAVTFVWNDELYLYGGFGPQKSAESSSTALSNNLRIDSIEAKRSERDAEIAQEKPNLARTVKLSREAPSSSGAPVNAFFGDVWSFNVKTAQWKHLGGGSSVGKTVLSDWPKDRGRSYLAHLDTPLPPLAGASAIVKSGGGGGFSTPTALVVGGWAFSSSSTFNFSLFIEIATLNASYILPYNTPPARAGAVLWPWAATPSMIVLYGGYSQNGSPKTDLYLMSATWAWTAVCDALFCATHQSLIWCAPCLVSVPANAPYGLRYATYIAANSSLGNSGVVLGGEARALYLEATTLSPEDDQGEDDDDDNNDDKQRRREFRGVSATEGSPDVSPKASPNAKQPPHAVPVMPDIPKWLSSANWTVTKSPALPYPDLPTQYCVQPNPAPNTPHYFQCVGDSWAATASCIKCTLSISIASGAPAFIDGDFAPSRLSLTVQDGTYLNISGAASIANTSGSIILSHQHFTNLAREGATSLPFIASNLMIDQPTLVGQPSIATPPYMKKSVTINCQKKTLTGSKWVINANGIPGVTVALKWTSEPDYVTHGCPSSKKSNRTLIIAITCSVAGLLLIALLVLAVWKRKVMAKHFKGYLEGSPKAEKAQSGASEATGAHAVELEDLKSGGETQMLSSGAGANEFGENRSLDASNTLFDENTAAEVSSNPWAGTTGEVQSAARPPVPILASPLAFGAALASSTRPLASSTSSSSSNQRKAHSPKSRISDHIRASSATPQKPAPAPITHSPLKNAKSVTPRFANGASVHAHPPTFVPNEFASPSDSNTTTFPPPTHDINATNGNVYSDWPTMPPATILVAGAAGTSAPTPSATPKSSLVGRSFELDYESGLGSFDSSDEFRDDNSYVPDLSDV